MKICARCFGSNIGHFFAILLFVVGYLPPWYYSVAFMCIMLIDWSLQTFLKIMSNNTRRFITGIIGGFGIGCIVWEGVTKMVNFIK